jgi:hypothetical protein
MLSKPDKIGELPAPDHQFEKYRLNKVTVADDD